MVPITQDFIPVGRRNRPGYPLTPAFITIHDTQNLQEGSDAEAHAKFLKGSAADVPASWHFTVDHDSIIQHLSLTENGWHAGDGGKGPGNRTSLAVEITENPDGNRRQAETNAAELVASLLKQFNLTPDKVVQHNYWSPKDCPRVLRARPGGWEGFLKQVQSFLMPVMPQTAGARLIIRGKEIPGGAILIDGKSYVWSRGFAEALGHTVRWDAATRTVYVDSEPTLPRLDRYGDYDVITCKPSQVIPKVINGVLKQDGINGGYNPIGALKINGQIISERVLFNKYGAPIPPRACLLLTGDKARIAKVDRLADVLDEHVLGAGPALLPDVAQDEGFQTDVMTSTRPRTAVGINDDGQLLLVSTAPMTLEELRNLMLGLGCKQAFNCDGGSKVSMRHGGEVIRGATEYITTALIIKEG